MSFVIHLKLFEIEAVKEQIMQTMESESRY